MVLRWQTLLLALLVGVLAGSSWAAFGAGGGALVFVGTLSVAAYIRFTVGWPLPLHLAVLISLVIFLVGWILPACQGVREDYRRNCCANNLHQIALALLNYEAQHGSLPPAYVADNDGKPIHSWRILILPYLEGKDLYDEYDFDEPWDGPNNTRLLIRRPLYYQCPADDGAPTQRSTTSYVAVRGARAVWQQDKNTSLRSLESQRKTGSTVMVIETAESGIAWTEPKDLSLDDLGTDSPRTAATIIRSPHIRDNGYFHHETSVICAGFADGHIEMLPASCPSVDMLKSLLAVGGGTQENIDALTRAENLPLHWPHCIGLPVWIVSVVWLLGWAVRGRKAAAKRAVKDNGVPVQS